MYFTVHVEGSASQLAGLAEELGGTAEVALDRGAVLLVAKVDPQREVTSGDPLQLELDLERIQLFDAESGRSLLVDAHPSGVGQAGAMLSKGA